MSGKFKSAFVLLFALVAVLSLAGMAAAIDVTVDKVEVNGQELRDGTTVNKLLDRGSELEVEVFAPRFYHKAQVRRRDAKADLSHCGHRIQAVPGQRGRGSSENHR